MTTFAWHRRLWLAFIAALVLVATARAAAEAGPLVGPDWLDQQRQSPAVLVLDASMPHQYAAGHIPGAVSASVFGIAGVEVAPAEMERRLRAWGVSPGRKIVVYDEGGSWMATRLVWDLHYHGVPTADLHLLDGGLHRWKAAGKAVTQEATPAPATGMFRVTRVRDEVRVRLDEFLVASGDTVNHAIVDALDPPYYYGGAKFFDRGGHIPNAKLWPASDFFDPVHKTFKSPDEIRRMLAHLGLKPGQTVHVYCGGGGAASVPVFALRFLLGRDKVKLYNESQREWLRDERGLPLRTHAAPDRLRRMAWLDGWGGPLLRMVGLAGLSVIDVRSPEAYRQGHVPFALNLPADVLRSHVQQGGEPLAALLGAAGVNVEHEAVVVAEGGLTPSAALALLLLERAGQKKVSLLADSFDDWALGGLPVAREPTVVGARKTPQDLAVPATVYPSQRVRSGVLLSAPPGAAGPRVTVAAGRQAPARVPADGSKLVHVPYADLLDANGMPKPAKDLWSLLAKAGVPRYAEIVCVGDDVGEAAVAWFVLKLMGFDDVKVAL